MPQFHNIATVFDELDDPYYLDAFHLTEDGNLIVAREIAKDVIRLVRGESATQLITIGGRSGTKI